MAHTLLWIKTFPLFQFLISHSDYYKAITGKKNYNLQFKFEIFSTNLDKSQLLPNVYYLVVLDRICKTYWQDRGMQALKQQFKYY